MKGLKTGLFCGLVLLCLASPGSAKRDKKKNRQKLPCESKECVEAAYHILQKIDPDQDPCEDFAKFACGNFYKETRIDDDMSRVNTLNSTREDGLQRARKLLESEDSEEDFEAEKMARRHYRSCMDDEEREKLGITPLEQILEKIGGWPVVEGQDWSGEGSFTWYDQMVRHSEQGIESSHSDGIPLSIYHFHGRTIHIDSPTKWGLPIMYLDASKLANSKKAHQSYLKFMIDSAVLLGANKTRAEAEMKKVLEFEIALYNISFSPEPDYPDYPDYSDYPDYPDYPDNNDTDYDYSQSNDFYLLKDLMVGPGLPSSWTKFFQDYFKPLEDPANPFAISEDDKVFVLNKGFVEQLGPLSVRFGARTVANYMVWRVVQDQMAYLNQAAKKIAQEFITAMYGARTVPPKWRRCVKEVGFDDSLSPQNAFRIACSTMYVRKYFTPEDKKLGLEIMQHLRASFKGILERSDWLDDKSRSEVLRKLEKMKQKIGYSDEILDKDLVDGLFKGLNVDEKTYLQNRFEVGNHWKKFAWRGLGQNVEISKYDWIDPYEPETLFMAKHLANMVEVTAGLFQGGFFYSKAPMYLNFGGIGFVMGHEMVHGFDNHEIHFNAKGHRMLTPEVAKVYKERAKCFVDLYNNYSIKNMTHNGTYVLSEVISDAGGIKAAYQGYKAWLGDQRCRKSNKKGQKSKKKRSCKKVKPEERLPGLSYTPEQMFWIRYGQVWCQKLGDQMLKHLMKTDVHPLMYLRTIGILVNNEEFAKDFNCPVNSPMNPEKKCAVW